MAPSGELPKDLTPEEFSRFRDWIHHHSGIFLEDQKSDPLRISLAARATRLGFTDLDEYYRLLGRDENEFKELLNLITINETSFFRFPAQFEAFRTRVIPEVLERKPAGAKRLRVWSAGCSTGEEPYTIAMSLLESAIGSGEPRPEVLGTDVSTEALGKAKHAVYPTKSVASLDANLVDRYFEHVHGGLKVAAPVRDIVTFQYHNLIKEPYPLALMGNWDAIFCRNVTIYFRLESTRRVVRNFFDSLNPGGYLFIGHSETLASISDQFETVHTNEVFLYRKPYPRRLFDFGEVLARPDEPARRASTTPSRTLGRGGALADATIAAAGEANSEAAMSDAAERVEGVYAAIEAGDVAAALTASRDVARLHPHDAQAQLAEAFASAEAGELDEAVAAAERALEVDPLVAPARYILGVISQRRGGSAKAIDEFKRTVYIDRDFVLAHFNLANLYRGQGLIDDARREYENTIASLKASPSGEWTRFLGGFSPDLILQTSERGLTDCRNRAHTG